MCVCVRVRVRVRACVRACVRVCVVIRKFCFKHYIGPSRKAVIANQDVLKDQSCVLGCL